MRILMSCDTLGGVFVYALELIAALEPHGAEVVLATMGRAPSKSQRRALRALRNVEVCCSEGALEWMDEPWHDVARDGEWLHELALQHRPDCVHLNHYAHGALPWPAPLLMVGHSCVLSWWQAVKNGPLPARYGHYLRVVRAGLRAAACVVAPSRAMLDALHDHYGPLGDARVIANGIAPGRFLPVAKRPLVLSAGRLWDEAKNVAALERVAPALPWPVGIAGEVDGPFEEPMTFRACHALGSLPRGELRQQLARAAIYALPARYEPFGLTVLEAASAGCALVLGRVPSLLENWSGAACFVDPDDPGELQRALLELISDPILRERMADRARERAAAFGATVMGAAYANLYRELDAAADAEREAPCAS